MPLVQTAGGLLYAYGSSRTEEDLTCDPAPLTTAASGPLIFDVGTPLSGFRTDPETRMSHLADAQLLIRDGSMTPSVLLCDVPMLAIGQTDPWAVKWNGETLSPVHAILGGDTLRSYSLGLTFGADPRRPLCPKPPCLTLGASDIADNCELSRTGEAVFPLSPTGGNLIVRVGDDVFTYPGTRLSLSACLEPLGDPLAQAQGQAVPCVPEGTPGDPFGVGQRMDTLTRAVTDPNASHTEACDCLLNLRIAQLAALDLMAKDPGTAAQYCRGADPNNTNHVLPPDFTGFKTVSDRLNQCAVLQARAKNKDQAVKDANQCFNVHGISAVTTFADVIDEEHLRDRRYEATGANVRLLISTALPGLLLSETAFRRLRGAAAETVLMGPPDATLQFPGQRATTAWKVTLGAHGAGGLVSALALLSKERFLDPCAELARSRRQRSALQTCLDVANPPDCKKAACLIDLSRGPQRPEQRCGYSGQNAPLACDDHYAPVAGVIEMDGPLDALVVPDDNDLLQGANGDVRNGAGAIDGIVGVSMLSRLQVEVDSPTNRLIAHCRCDGPATCRTYPRYTDTDADDCQFNSNKMCLPTPVSACGG